MNTYIIATDNGNQCIQKFWHLYKQSLKPKKEDHMKQI